MSKCKDKKGFERRNDPSNFRLVSSLSLQPDEAAKRPKNPGEWRLLTWRSPSSGMWYSHVSTPLVGKLYFTSDFLWCSGFPSSCPRFMIGDSVLLLQHQMHIHVPPDVKKSGSQVLGWTSTRNRGCGTAWNSHLHRLQENDASNVKRTKVLEELARACVGCAEQWWKWVLPRLGLFWPRRSYWYFSHSGLCLNLSPGYFKFQYAVVPQEFWPSIKSWQGFAQWPHTHTHNWALLQELTLDNNIVLYLSLNLDQHHIGTWCSFQNDESLRC